MSSFVDAEGPGRCECVCWGERGEWLEGSCVAVVDVAAGSPAFTIRFSPKCDRRNMWFVFPPTDEPIDFFSDPEIFKLRKTLEAKWI